MNQNILLCGVGGQGILLAAKIIALAAEKAGFEVTTNEVHGMAQRGGSVTAQLRYGDAVYSPLILERQADVLASMEMIEALRYAHFLKPGGLAAVSTQKIIPVTVSSGKMQYPADAEARLREVFPRLELCDCLDAAIKMGNAKLANTILLGTLSAGLAGIDLPLWESAISECVKPAFVEANLAAFRFGRKENER